MRAPKKGLVRTIVSPDEAERMRCGPFVWTRHKATGDAPDDSLEGQLKDIAAAARRIWTKAGYSSEIETLMQSLPKGGAANLNDLPRPQRAAWVSSSCTLLLQELRAGKVASPALVYIALMVGKGVVWLHLEPHNKAAAEGYRMRSPRKKGARVTNEGKMLPAGERPKVVEEVVAYGRRNRQASFRCACTAAAQKFTCPNGKHPTYKTVENICKDASVTKDNWRP